MKLTLEELKELIKPEFNVIEQPESERKYSHIIEIYHTKSDTFLVDLYEDKLSWDVISTEIDDYITDNNTNTNIHLDNLKSILLRHIRGSKLTDILNVI